MLTTLSRQIIAVLLVAAFLPACEIHRRTIREYNTDPAGHVSVTNVTEDVYWKERVHERIAAEIAHRHGGRLAAAPSGQGGRVALELPLAGAARVARA